MHFRKHKLDKHCRLNATCLNAVSIMMYIFWCIHPIERNDTNQFSEATISSNPDEIIEVEIMLYVDLLIHQLY